MTKEAMLKAIEVALPKGVFARVVTGSGKEKEVHYLGGYVPDEMTKEEDARGLKHEKSNLAQAYKNRNDIIITKYTSECGSNYVAYHVYVKGSERYNQNIGHMEIVDALPDDYNSIIEPIVRDWNVRPLKEAMTEQKAIIKGYAEKVVINGETYAYRTSEIDDEIKGVKIGEELLEIPEARFMPHAWEAQYTICIPQGDKTRAFLM